MREYTFFIGPEDEGRSIGDYLRRRRSFSARALTKLRQVPRGILLGGLHARTVDRLRAGDVLTVTMEEPEKDIPPVARRVEILHEDEDLMIWNKPPGMPCHTSCGHAVDTLENVWAAHCIAAGAPIVPLRALNRLDADTSGCVLTAKNRFVASRLKDRFEKEYCALVQGEISAPGVVDAPIWRPDPVDLRRVVDERGQRAVTEYTPVRSGGGATLLTFRLGTGRTHQIRVHMAHLGHPVIGDALYGLAGEGISRQALHCLRLWFHHPVTGETIHARAPLPPDFLAACRAALGEGPFV